MDHFKKEFEKLSSDRAVIRGVLRKGAERVAPIAESTMKQVRERVGSTLGNRLLFFLCNSSKGFDRIL